MLLKELKVKLKLVENQNSFQNFCESITDYGTLLKLNNYGSFGSALTNLIVIAIFVAFIYIVLYVFSVTNSTEISKL